MEKRIKSIVKRKINEREDIMNEMERYISRLCFVQDFVKKFLSDNTRVNSKYSWEKKYGYE